MSIALTRSELIEFQRNMPKHSRGRQAIGKLVQLVTTDELRFETELEAVMAEQLARDPEYREAR